MDAFYASVEQRDNPKYRGKAIVVGGKSNRGVVAAASYEARKYGIKSAMPVKTALYKYPKLIVVKPRLDEYRSVSMQIRGIFHQYTDLVEPLSLDEAFLDVTCVKKGPPSATLIAEDIRRKIYEATGLTSSAGVSINKFLAKIASDINKPNGIFVITPEKAPSFIETLPVEKFFGVGKVTASRMHEMGIHTGGDLKRMPQLDLVKRFGKAGQHYHNIAHGIDHRPVNPNRERKSVGTETTFEEDLHSYDEIKNAIKKIAVKLDERNERAGLNGRTLTLKVKYNDFVQITRSRSCFSAINGIKNILGLSTELVDQVVPLEKPVRLLGLSISNPSRIRVDGQLVLEF